MRALPVIALLALTAAGCRDVDERPSTNDADGVACAADTTGQQAVYIELDYADDPSRMAPCEVDRNTLVTWRAPAARSGFALDFGAVSPAGRGQPQRYESMMRDGVPKVQLQADNEPGSYPYDIIVAGASVDPVIIIRRAQSPR